MTSEERLDKIEQIIERQNKGIQDLIRLSGIFLDSQKQVTAQIEGLRDAQREAYGELHEIQRKDHEVWTAQMQGWREAQAAMDEKLNILIEHESALDAAQTRTDAQIQELREAQKETDQKLRALIDTVDKIVRHNGRKGEA
jgi:chromosome segregation ATPase